MATTYKTSQVQGTANIATYATLYNTGGSTTAVISTISICNTSISSASYRIAIMGSAGTPAAENWIVFDSVVPGNDTIFLTAGIALGNTSFIRVSSSASTVAFSSYVSEIS